MEYTLIELLTREDIIKILKQRQLRISEIDKLSMDELVRIYKNFAIPLARRPATRSSTNKQNVERDWMHDSMECIPNSTSNNSSSKSNHCMASSSEMETEDDSQAIQSTKIALCSQDLCNKKRPAHGECFGEMKLFADDYLIKATKRIKIDWPYEGKISTNLNKTNFCSGLMPVHGHRQLMN